MTVVFENPANGYKQEVDSVTSWLWTSIFGPFFFLFRGSTLHFFLWWLFAFTAIGPFIYPFFAASILRRMYYERGYRAVAQRPTSKAVVLSIAAVPVVVIFIIFVASMSRVITDVERLRPASAVEQDSPPPSTPVESHPPPPSLSAERDSPPASPPTGGSDSPQAPVASATPVARIDQPATFQPRPAASPPSETLYFILGTDLNVRTGPGANFPITVKLPGGFEGIRVIGASVMNDTTEWVPIAFGTQSGWVARRFLSPQ